MYTELEFTDAALHAEQQPVVWPTRCKPVQVDHPGLDQAAELEQVMPIAAVASEPGSVKAQDGSDLAGTQPCH
jgi:hypothetical protein